MPKKQSSPLSVLQAVQVFQLLGDPSRLRILQVLLDREEVCVGDVCAAVGQSQAAVSHHLMLLRRGRLVEYRRAGQQNFYRVSSAVVPELLERVGAG
jgi:ArsR family transcriptional regulator